jgi:Zn-dependent peptidase ImmA (M78 family)
MTAADGRPNYSRVKREAKRLLTTFGFAEPPVDPVQIARSLGTSVHFVRFSERSSDVSGFYDAVENAIYVNAEEYPLRQTFTVAHELCHSLLHKEWAASSEYKILLRDQAANDNDPYEKEANAFAANLLVPREFLDRYISLTPEQLSRLFAVSVPMIKNRLAFEYGY